MEKEPSTSSDMDNGIGGQEELESDEMDDSNREGDKGDERGDSNGGDEGAEGLGTDWARSSACLARRIAMAEGAAHRGRKQPSEPHDRLIFKDKGMGPAERRNLESFGIDLGQMFLSSSIVIVEPPFLESIPHSSQLGP